MFLVLCIYNSLIHSLSPSTLLKGQSDKHREHAILSTIPCQNSFYEDGVLYFLRSSSIQDFECRVARWCARFGIPEEFDRQWTPLWYGKENIIPFEEIKARWKKDYDWEDSLELFNEMRTRNTEVVSRYVSSYSGNQKTSLSSTYESCLQHLLSSPSVTEYNRRIEKYCRDFHIPKSTRSIACVSQEHHDITAVIEDLHREWQKIIQEKIPDHIDNQRSCSIETLLMFGALSCMSFNSISLRKEIWQRIHASPKSDYPPMMSLDKQTKEALETAGFINDDAWNERQIYLMTSSQKSVLTPFCDTKVVTSLYSQSFFYLLRELAHRGLSTTIPYTMREQFISELEFYMVELYARKEDGFLKEKRQRTLSFLNISSLRDYDVYVESVHHFYQKMKRLNPQLKSLALKEGSYRTEEEIQELWTNLLKGNEGLCPAGAIERPLFYLEEFYDWSNLSCEKDMFFNLLEHYYAHTIEKLAGLEVLYGDIYAGNEAHIRTRIHNILSQSPYGYLSEIDKQEKDIHALPDSLEQSQYIKRHFSALFTPLHFGGYVLEFFQDKRFLKIFAHLKKARQFKDLFIDDHYQAFRINHFILCLGEGFISFSSPEVLRKQIWIAHVHSHQFSQLHQLIYDIPEEERKLYWNEMTNSQQTCLEYVLTQAQEADIKHLQTEIHREINTFSLEEQNALLQNALCSPKRTLLDQLMKIWGEKELQNIISQNFTEFLYECLHYKSLNTLKNFLLWTKGLNKTHMRFIDVLHICLQRGFIGLDLLKCLLNNAVVSFPQKDGYFLPNGKSLLSHIIMTVKREDIALAFVRYLSEQINILSTLSDMDNNFFTPLHWACQYGRLDIVRCLIEESHVPPNYRQGHRTAIGIAAENGHNEIVKYLNGRGVPATIVDTGKRAWTPLHWACFRGHLPVVEWLIERAHVNPNNSYYPIRQRVASLAAIAGHQQVIEYLDKQGFSFAVADSNREAHTPFEWACLKGQLSIVKWFVEKKRLHFDFLYPIKLAMSQYHVAVVEYFVLEVGFPPTEEIELFLRKYGNLPTREILKEIETLSGFLNRGYNPFLSTHRFNQVRKAMKEENFNPILEKISCWSHYFVHNESLYSKTLNFWDKLFFWNKRDLNRLQSMLVLKSS